MLIMQGTGAHGGPGVIEPSPDNNAVDLRSLQLRFYDRHVKGIDNGIDREPPVPLARDGHAGCRQAERRLLGERRGRSRRREPGSSSFNLRSRGRANTRMGDGMLDRDRPSDGPEDRFTYDPMNPVPTLGGGLCCVTLGSYFPSGAQDQSSLEMRDDVLVYTSGPLTKDLAVVGPVTLKFWAKSSARDTDFTAKLVDVHPDGFRAEPARSNRPRSLPEGLEIGAVPDPAGCALRVPRSTSDYTGAQIRAGHRIRIDISSSNFPHYARNPEYRRGSRR